MRRTWIQDLPKQIGQEVRVSGWVHHRRSKGKLHFLVIRDGSGFLQAVFFAPELPPEMFEAAGHAAQESVLALEGVVRADERSPGGVELGVTRLEKLADAQDFPISPKEHGDAFLLDHRHLWLRSRKQHAIQRVRNEFLKSCRDFFYERDFVCVDAPIFTPAACEGTTTLFETDYFDQKAYLSQSGQLYMEAAALALGRVYCLGPTFRAEKSKTRRHLMEFWMLEPEVAFADLDDIMQLEEEMLSYVVGRALDRCREELKVLERDTTALARVQAPFPRVSYDQAVEILNREKPAGEPRFEWGGDFGAPDETIISSGFDRPVFVHGFPAAIKAFYMKRDPKNPAATLSVDCLAPEGYGEIIGGGQREDRLDLLLERIAEHKLPQAPYEWYLDLRRYGSVPHAGYGMGIERTVSWICGLEHLREAIAFPRMLYRLTP